MTKPHKFEVNSTQSRSLTHFEFFLDKKWSKSKNKILLRVFYREDFKNSIQFEFTSNLCGFVIAFLCNFFLCGFRFFLCGEVIDPSNLGEVKSDWEDVNFFEYSIVKSKIHVPYFFDLGLNSGNIWL